MSEHKRTNEVAARANQPRHMPADCDEAHPLAVQRDGLPTTQDPHPSNEDQYDKQRRPGGAGTGGSVADTGGSAQAVTENYAEPGEPNDPQERGTGGHDGHPSPPEAKAPEATNVMVNTEEDYRIETDPLAGLPVPEDDPQPSHIGDSDQHALKPVIRQPNDRTGGA